MTTLQLHSHRRRLIARGRCPGCAEILVGASLYGGAPCSYCETPTELFGITSKDAATAFQKKAWIQLGLLFLFVGVTYFILGWIPFLGGLALLAAAIWIKMGILYPITGTFHLRRRIVARWSVKMVLAILMVATFVLCELMTLTGLFSGFMKALIGAVHVTIAAGLVTLYVSWQIRREQRQVSVGWWEWGIVGTATVGVAGTAAASVLLLAGFAYAFQWVIDTTLPLLL